MPRTRQCLRRHIHCSHPACLTVGGACFFHGRNQQRPGSQSHSLLVVITCKRFVTKRYILFLEMLICHRLTEKHTLLCSYSQTQEHTCTRQLPRMVRLLNADSNHLFLLNPYISHIFFLAAIYSCVLSEHFSI